MQLAQEYVGQLEAKQASIQKQALSMAAELAELEGSAGQVGAHGTGLEWPHGRGTSTCRCMDWIGRCRELGCSVEVPSECQAGTEVQAAVRMWEGLDIQLVWRQCSGQPHAAWCSSPRSQVC